MNIKMQCCGIALLLVILYFYICRKKIKLNTSMAFMRLFWVAMINLILDTLSIALLTYHDSVPEIIINLVCKSYISAMVLTSYFSLLYLCTDIYGKITTYLKIFVPATVVAAMGVTLIYVLPIYQNLENLDRVYTYGPSVLTTYIFSLTFLLWIVVLLIRHKTDINPRRLIALRIWMLLWICSACTQFVFNEFLLVGFANAIGIVIIYLKLENPEINIDTSTGLFNQEAMILYTEQCLTNKEEFAVIELTFPFSLSIHSSDKEQCLAKEELIAYLSEITDAYAFKNEENRVLCIDFKTLILIGIATSIDAFSAGITISLTNSPLLFSIISIGVITFANSFFGFAGGFCLKRFNSKALEITGGVLLIALAINSLI